MIDPNQLAWKGTPYPWRATRRIGMTQAWDIYDNGGDIRLASVDSNVMEKTTIEANAHVIEVAPEAVELLADILEWHDSNGEPLPKIMIDRIETVLKKAYNF